MRSDPVPLFFWKGGNRLIEPGIFFFLFQDFSRCQNNHQGVAFHIDIVIQRKVCFVPVCTQKRSCLC